MSGILSIDPSTIRREGCGRSGIFERTTPLRTYLHILHASIPRVKKLFIGLYARTLCHTTEDLAKVKEAVTNVLGDTELRISKTVGHHGNPITVIESAVDEMNRISGFFAKVDDHDISVIEDTLATRVDDGCNLFLKIDKQEAFLGKVRLGHGDDVISLRIRMAAFPATCEVAQNNIREYLAVERARRGGTATTSSTGHADD
jgi:RNA binding exosome subunit